MTAAIDSLQALKSQLETITVANGYANDVKAVSIGRDALAVGSETQLPIITITTLRDAIPADNGADIEASTPVQYWDRIAEIEALVDGGDDWEIAIDALLNDVRRAFVRYRKPLRMGAPTFLPPADGGNAASFLLAITFPYSVTYFD